jgi:transporter family protein
MKGWLLPALGTFFFWGFWAFLPKVTERYVGLTSSLVYQVFGSILVGVGVLVVSKSGLEFHPLGLSLGVLTGVLGYLGLFSFLQAVSRGPISLAVPITALYPVLAVILARFILQETITPKQGLGIALSLIAIILIST